jgi:hypothetical protein
LVDVEYAVCAVREAARSRLDPRVSPPALFGLHDIVNSELRKRPQEIVR